MWFASWKLNFILLLLSRTWLMVIRKLPFWGFMDHLFLAYTHLLTNKTLRFDVNVAYVIWCDLILHLLYFKLNINLQNVIVFYIKPEYSSFTTMQIIFHDLNKWRKCSAIFKPIRWKEMFYLMMHSAHFIYRYLVSDTWLWTAQIMREVTCCHHFMGYSFQLEGSNLFNAPIHSQTSTYLDLCYNKNLIYIGHQSNCPMFYPSIHPYIHPLTYLFTQ